MKNIEIMINRIEKIIETGAQDCTYGICSHIATSHANNINIKEILSSWDKYSGDWEFPIPHPTLDPEQAYFCTENLWDRNTIYGRNRWEALYYLTGELKKILEKHDE